MIQKETFNSAVKNHDFDVLSVSSAVIISAISRMPSGPKMLSGGWSNVTRQYDGERRASRISMVFVAGEFWFFIFFSLIIPF